MSYKSLWTLRIITDIPEKEALLFIRRFRESNAHAEVALQEDGNPEEECSWPFVEIELAKFSGPYPELLMFLEYCGEDGERGGYYACEGKSYAVFPKVIWPEFDPVNLKKHLFTTTKTNHL